MESGGEGRGLALPAGTMGCFISHQPLRGVRRQPGVGTLTGAAENCSALRTPLLPSHRELLSAAQHTPWGSLAFYLGWWPAQIQQQFYASFCSRPLQAETQSQQLHSSYFLERQLSAS